MTREDEGGGWCRILVTRRREHAVLARIEEVVHEIASVEVVAGLPRRVPSHPHDPHRPDRRPNSRLRRPTPRGITSGERRQRWALRSYRVKRRYDSPTASVNHRGAEMIRAVMRTTLSGAAQQRQRRPAAAATSTTRRPVNLLCHLYLRLSEWGCRSLVRFGSRSLLYFLLGRWQLLPACRGVPESDERALVILLVLLDVLAMQDSC
ncbi:hypothetical protein EJB05_49722, partial [Eragrostis curvula]